jgi:GcrA cell cycle regulator
MPGQEGANWTEERKEILRTMAMTHSAGLIAAALGEGFTRNMVIGKCRRMGLELEGGYRFPRRGFLPGNSVRRKSLHLPVLKNPAPAPVHPVRLPHWKPGGILAKCGGWASGW